MASHAEVQQTLLDSINAAAEGTDDSRRLLRLAEAYAWLTSPNNAHGGNGGAQE